MTSTSGFGGRWTQGERRYQPRAAGEPIIAVCRSCWAHIELVAERFEIVEGRAWYRCQKCEQSFLARWDDAVALGMIKPPQ